MLMQGIENLVSVVKCVSDIRAKSILFSFFTVISSFP